jgi:glucosamine--fructose-6-phosphate aminotransferase (isomerizing)
MCGIFGYVGARQDAATLVLDGLKKLEYRGYDSWGLAVHCPAAAPGAEARLLTLRQVGKISGAHAESGRLHALLREARPTGLALGHSRWATHGGVTEANAHPHHGCRPCDFALVHNGIVENHHALKETLLADGHRFTSQTDTEVIAHLAEAEFARGATADAALAAAFSLLEGRNAVAVLHGATGTLLAVRRGSPLVVGIGPVDPATGRPGAFFLSSDTPALLEHTHHVVFLEDDDLVVLGGPAWTDGAAPAPDSLPCRNVRTGVVVHRRAVPVTWDAGVAEKGPYAHFMLKEILEQREAVARALTQEPAPLATVAATLKVARTVLFAGCGTAGKVAGIATYLFSDVAARTTTALFGSEFATYAHSVDAQTVLVAISQSGETADLLEAVEVARARGTTIVAIVNVPGSTLARLADYTLPVNAGPEKAVASTKATVGQIAVLTLLAYACAGREDEGRAVLEAAAAAIPTLLTDARRAAVRALAALLRDAAHLYIIGRGLHFPVAQEAAIKVQEVSYIHAEGLAGGELKHYALALVQQGVPCIVLAGHDPLREAILSNAAEVKARGGLIVGVAPDPAPDLFDVYLPVPDAGLASPITTLVPLQLLAYELAVARGYDPDMPRNLAKSVTVR